MCCRSKHNCDEYLKKKNQNRVESVRVQYTYKFSSSFMYVHFCHDVKYISYFGFQPKTSESHLEVELLGPRMRFPFSSYCEIVLERGHGTWGLPHEMRTRSPTHSALYLSVRATCSSESFGVSPCFLCLASCFQLANICHDWLFFSEI